MRKHLPLEDFTGTLRQAHMHTYTYLQEHMYVCTYVHMYTHAHAHTYVRTSTRYVHTYIGAHMVHAHHRVWHGLEWHAARCHLRDGDCSMWANRRHTNTNTQAVYTAGAPQICSLRPALVIQELIRLARRLSKMARVMKVQVIRRGPYSHTSN